MNWLLIPAAIVAYCAASAAFLTLRFEMNGKAEPNALLEIYGGWHPDGRE